MKLDQKVARQPEINPLNITNYEKQKENRAADQFFSSLLGLDKCFVRKMGFNFYVDLHIIVNGELSVREGHRVAHLVEDSVLRELSQISEVLVHVELEEELTAKGIARVK
jgi:divalent metal cation (Fe/Co/Zn/Cd) transporter